MMKLAVKKGDLFTPYHRPRILVHACNGKGVWGSGIAVEFKNRFPWAFEAYALNCKDNGRAVMGTAQVITHEDSNEAVGCLFTSFDYGKKKDEPDKILKYTETSVRNLLTQVHPHSFEIHTPKINSGLFAVPWAETEAVLNRVLSQFNHTWIVWEKE